MGRVSPFQSTDQQDAASQVNPFNKFRKQIQRMQRIIENNITIMHNRDVMKGAATRFNAGTGELGPTFGPVPSSKPKSPKHLRKHPPAISDPSFRPDIPTPTLEDPFGGSKEVQAGPETMTDADPRSEARKAFFEGLVRRGMPPIAAAGLTGNVEQESGFDPEITGDINPKTGKPRSFGAFQVQRSRRDAFFEFAKAENKDPNNIETQMDFAFVEMFTTEKRAARALFDAKTVEEASAAAIGFFRPSDPKAEKRLQNALKIQIEGSTAPTTPAGAPTVPGSVPGDRANVVAPQGPSAGRAVTPPRPARPKPAGPPPAPPLPDIDLGPPGMAQVTPRRPIVPVLWQQAVAKFQETRDPKDLASVPKSGLPAILALMGRVARRAP